jgi:hypothetical protein
MKKNMSSSIVEALDRFETALIEFCQTHVLPIQIKKLEYSPEEKTPNHSIEDSQKSRTLKKVVNGTANQSFS